MSIELIDKIFADLINEREKPDGVVSKEFEFFTTAHYNEILLYKHIEELLDLARKYSLKTYILSNGISLHKRSVDMITEYKDVVAHVGLNVPAFERELWAKRAGFSEDQFDRLISNIEYAQEKLGYLSNNFQIHVNGLERGMFDRGWITKGPEFDSHGYDLDSEHQKQFMLAQKLFPRISVNKASIFDRAGFINHVVTNEPHIKYSNMGKKVVGCTNFGDRISDWLHVNSAGKTFLCCNDYNFDYTFGDLNTQSVADIWLSDKHAEVIEKALGGICTKCVSAVFESDKKSTTKVYDGTSFSRKK